MYERMLDQSVRPAVEDMVSHCGENGALFTETNRFLQEDCGTRTEIRFPYGRRYGWSIHHKRKSKHVCDLFPEAGALTVMLRMSDAQFDSVYGELLPYTREFIDRKYPCGEGGWIHYRLLGREHLEDLKKLLGAKLGVEKRR